MAAETERRQGKPREKSNFAVACTLLSQYIKAKDGAVDLALGVGSQNLLAPKGKSEVVRPPATLVLLPGANVSAGDRVDGEKTLQNVMALFSQRAGFRNSVAASETLQNVMALFSQRAGFRNSVAASEEDAREMKRSQLTIFYGGKVLVFDNFPADKAENLMQLASNGASSMQNSNYISPSSTSAVAVNDHTNGMSNRNSNLVAAILSNSVATHVELKKSGQSSSSDLPIARKSSLQRFLEKRKDRIKAKAPYQVKGSPASSNPVKQGGRRITAWLGPVETRFATTKSVPDCCW